MSFISTPSLASATSTAVDSACKHIQQCRVSYDHMLDFVGSAHELERSKMQYCVHKDEMAVGITRPWAKDMVRTLPPSAFPRILSCLGDITLREEYKDVLKMIKYVYHFSTSIRKRDAIITQMKTRGANTIDHHNPAGNRPFFAESGAGSSDSKTPCMPSVAVFFNARKYKQGLSALDH